MSHNYRIFRHEDELGEPVFGIHTTFYREDGTIEGWGQNPIIVGASVEELLRVLEQLRDAAFMPVVDMKQEERWARERPTGKHERLI